MSSPFQFMCPTNEHHRSYTESVFDDNWDGYDRVARYRVVDAALRKVGWTPIFNRYGHILWVIRSDGYPVPASQLNVVESSARQDMFSVSRALDVSGDYIYCRSADIASGQVEFTVDPDGEESEVPLLSYAWAVNLVAYLKQPTWAAHALTHAYETDTFGRPNISALLEVTGEHPTITNSMWEAALYGTHGANAGSFTAAKRKAPMRLRATKVGRTLLDDNTFWRGSVAYQILREMNLSLFYGRQTGSVPGSDIVLIAAEHYNLSIAEVVERLDSEITVELLQHCDKRTLPTFYEYLRSEPYEHDDMEELALRFARNPYTEPEHLLELALYPWDEVQEAVIANPSTPMRARTLATITPGGIR